VFDSIYTNIQINAVLLSLLKTMLKDLVAQLQDFFSWSLPLAVCKVFLFQFYKLICYLVWLLASSVAFVIVIWVSATGPETWQWAHYNSYCSIWPAAASQSVRVCSCGQFHNGQLWQNV